ncbi:protein O-mannosyl-transferase TMTC3-like [Mytilus californianus]|uniref:protein O-mannosyl-transferase TMTC3-like n=1 Tax=Mytilus californianus TaxID=6549 RepID=UPI0022456E71|nr:protein O-mannosyl-transferase TMTC3-like [Mytilus californianus]
MEKFNVYSAILCAVVAVCYHNALDCGFVFDDMSAIVENKDLKPRVPVINLFWNDFWGTPMHMEKSHKSYRPLCVLTFRMNYMISEIEPMSYHLINVILHAVVCIVLMKICTLFMKEFTSFLAALLFAVHPVHTEAVTGVVGRAECLSSIFFLAALWSYSRCTGYKSKTVWPPLIYTVILVTVAMLCKEIGITVIGVCCVYEVFIVQRATFTECLQIIISTFKGKPVLPSWFKDSVIRCVFLVGTTMFLMVARIKVMGAQLPIFTRFDNPASMEPFPTKHMTYNYLLPVNTWILVNPSHLCCDWTMGTIPVINSLLDHRNLITLLFYAILARFVVYMLSQQNDRNRAVIMCLTMIILPFIPASNLFFPVGFVVAERILYTPSMGFCALVALGFEILMNYKRELKAVLWACMGILLLTHGTKTYMRNFDWKSEYSLFRSALKVNQQNAKLFNNVGHALEKDQNWSEALEYFQKAVSVQPDDIGAHINVGRTYNNMNMSTEAEEAYMKALHLFPPIIPGRSYTARIAPNHLNVYLNLATLMVKNDSRLHEADKMLQTAVSMRPDYVQGYINRGDIMVKLGRMKEAIEIYKTALKYEPDNADVYYNLGVVSLELKDPNAARIYFETALQHDPDHWQSLYNSAIMIQEHGNVNDWPELERRLQHLEKKNPNDPKIYFTMGMLDMDRKDYVSAEKHIKKCLQYEPTFRSALFNLALMLVNNLNKPLEALPYLNTLLQNYPDHTKGMMLLGDINVNVQKDLDSADKHFRRVVELEPDNIQANHNLCVVMVERGDLFGAEKCLTKVYNMAPNEKYIINHLNIVRTKLNQAIKARREQKLKQQEQQQQHGKQSQTKN